MRKQFHVYLHGVVQGVGMRIYVKEVADSYRLKGFIRNLRDGRVEALFEGEEGALQNALKEIREGSFGGYVKKMDCTTNGATGEYSNFSITYER